MLFLVICFLSSLLPLNCFILLWNSWIFLKCFGIHSDNTSFIFNLLYVKVYFYRVGMISVSLWPPLTVSHKLHNLAVHSGERTQYCYLLAIRPYLPFGCMGYGCLGTPWWGEGHQVVVLHSNSVVLPAHHASTANWLWCLQCSVDAPLEYLGHSHSLVMVSNRFPTRVDMAVLNDTQILWWQVHRGIHDCINIHVPQQPWSWAWVQMCCLAPPLRPGHSQR